uniref:Uncharacterized protein n=1 Tax=Pseudo-nitzschia australis TaxID=44445 RepID=A0A7S4ERR4_9STRA
MDRVVAMLILLALLVTFVFLFLALFAMAPICCSCLLSLVYTLYLFVAYEEHGVHHAQEYENRFWTIFAMLFSTALLFAQDSPVAIGKYSPSLGFVGVLVSSYAMHVYDRYMHRIALSQQTKLRRTFSLVHSIDDQKVTVEQYLFKINECLQDIDQPLIPSTINNFLNRRFVLKKEKEIIDIFLACDATTLNYLVCHLKLALLVYKIKDHGFGGQHRTELIQILAVERLAALTVYSRVIVLHALQILKLRANPRAEYWVRNILLNSTGDDLSDIKTLTDAKGDYYCMSKLIYDDIKSETVRHDILIHMRKEGAMQVTRRHLGTKRGPKRRYLMAWRKILSDVDDTLMSSGGHYPAGIDKRYPKKVVYPGVLAFYRELDLGTSGPDDWPEERVGNLVFLSARPHVYKDMSEKSNFAKFEKMRAIREDGRRGMHTTPSLLAGDLASGSQYITTNDFEPLALKKFENFKRYVSIYPEYQHIFVCDNGQGDVKAGEMMHDNFPYEYQATYVHIVQDRQQTYGYAPERWQEKEFRPCFFTTYPEAALHAATQDPPLIRMNGLSRVCSDAVKDFNAIPNKKWQSSKQKAERLAELNQSIWKVNKILANTDAGVVSLVQAERLWEDGEKVRTPYGNGTINGFDSDFDLYDVELDWRPLDVQVREHLAKIEDETIRPKQGKETEKRPSTVLETVVETDEVTIDDQGIECGDEIDNGIRRTPLKEARTVACSTTPEEHEVTENDDASNSLMIDESETTMKENEIDNDAVSSSTTHSVANSTNDSKTGLRGNGVENSFKATAKIRGRSITKFIPPSLPTFNNKRTTPLFSFWVATPKTPVSVGEKCSTPYGPATIVEHRADEKMVVVDMIGWTARAYLNEDEVKVTKESLLSTLFRRQVSTSDSPPAQKFDQFPYVKGSIIRTPYGNAEIIIPLSIPDNDSTDSHDISDKTVCLSVTSWTLANGSHPKLYSTVKTCQTWKDANEAKGIFSASGSLVSTIYREIKGRLITTTTTQKPKDEGLAVSKFKQYYCDSAAVSTAFGNGRVIEFRENDGFYCVSLSSWKLANGRSPTAWLQEKDISYQLAKGCKEGYPVLTNLGVSGILESVQPTTGIHIVSAPSARMVLYLQPEAICHELKAAVGEDALTAYGEGIVERYDKVNDTYVIKLNGWSARIYAKAETFDRRRDSMRDKNGSLGMDWLMRFFFPPSDSINQGTRSRSGSVVSGTSTSVISLKTIRGSAD